jgi:hypothetical protein
MLGTQLPLKVEVLYFLWLQAFSSCTRSYTSCCWGALSNKHAERLILLESVCGNIWGRDQAAHLGMVPSS